MSTHVLFDVPGPKARRRIRILNIVGVLVLLSLLAWVVTGLAGKGQLAPEKWQPFLTASIWENYLIPGILATIKAAAVAMVTSNVFGLIFGIGRLSQLRVVRILSGTVVEFFRAVPVLLMMIFFYFLFSTSGIMKATDAPFWAVICGLTLYNGSVMAELVRSGVLNLPRGQREAGMSLGLRGGQILFAVLLPQALVAMMPSMISQLVVILKDTALGYLITYSELLRQARLIGTSQQNLVPALIVIALLFILINYGLTKLADVMALRLRGRTAGSTSVLLEADEGLTPGMDQLLTEYPEGESLVELKDHDYRE